MAITWRNATRISKKACLKLFKEKYMPMMELTTLSEPKLSTKDIMVIYELDYLPAECKAPQVGINSSFLIQESIRSQDDVTQKYCTKSLSHVLLKALTAEQTCIYPALGPSQL